MGKSEVVEVANAQEEIAKEEKEDLKYISQAEYEGFGIISEGYQGAYKSFFSMNKL